MTEKVKVSTKTPRILIVRTDKIGDTVLSVNVPEFIKRIFPNSYTGMLVRPYTAPIIENNPYIDDIIVDNNAGTHKGLKGFFRLADQIRKMNFDIALILFSKPRAAILTRIAGIPYCVGPASKIECIFYHKPVLQKRSRGEKHESEYNMDIAYAGLLGAFKYLTPEQIQAVGKTIKPSLYVTDDERKKTNNTLLNMGIEEHEKVVVVHPGSGGSARNWSPEQYGVICDKIRAGKYGKVVVTWGPGEKGIVDKLNNSTQSPHITFGGENTGLRTLMGLLDRASVIFTSSTGPLHIGGALGTRTVSVYCPIRVCLPGRWGPRGYKRQHRVFVPNVSPCECCTESQCPHFNCMDTISYEDIISAICEQLEEQ